VVTINGQAAPSRFSGTYSDAFGAVHGAMPGNVEIYAEVLTHEAGHMWLNLVADQDAAFIRNPYKQQCFVSPWRNDARPIHGIFHGAYVFSVVIPALVAMRTETAKARAAQLTVEVKDGLSQVLAFGSLSPEALEIAISAEARVRDFEQELGAGALALARAKYAQDKESKVRRLKSVQPELHFA
jgi:HEXXH motif-containing protein